MTDSFDYASYIDTAMRSAVREILRQAERTGLPGAHHFFIALRSDYPGVVMSEALRARHPREITIVLQHQFWDLHVADDFFTVTLSFNNIPEKLVVPFAAITGFADPSTKFGLQFHVNDAKVPVTVPAAAMTPPAAMVAADESRESAQILALDAFRKK